MYNIYIYIFYVYIIYIYMYIDIYHILYIYNGVVQWGCMMTSRRDVTGME